MSLRTDPFQLIGYRYATGRNEFPLQLCDLKAGMNPSTPNLPKKHFCR